MLTGAFESGIFGWVFEDPQLRLSAGGAFAALPPVRLSPGDNGPGARVLSLDFGLASGAIDRS